MPSLSFSEPVRTSWSDSGGLMKPGKPSSGSSGAAAEPEPSEVPSTRTAAATAATGYNVRDYQNPDAGAADQPLTKAAKGKGKGKAKGKKGGTTSVCFHCGKSGAKLRSCGQCHRAYYCSRECQNLLDHPQLPFHRLYYFVRELNMFSGAFLRSFIGPLVALLICDAHLPSHRILEGEVRWSPAKRWRRPSLLFHFPKYTSPDCGALPIRLRELLVPSLAFPNQSQ